MMQKTIFLVHYESRHGSRFRASRTLAGARKIAKEWMAEIDKEQGGAEWGARREDAWESGCGNKFMTIVALGLQ